MLHFNDTIVKVSGGARPAVPRPARRRRPRRSRSLVLCIRSVSVSDPPRNTRRRSRPHSASNTRDDGHTASSVVIQIWMLSSREKDVQQLPDYDLMSSGNRTNVKETGEKKLNGSVSFWGEKLTKVNQTCSNLIGQTRRFRPPNSAYLLSRLQEIVSL